MPFPTKTQEGQILPALADDAAESEHWLARQGSFEPFSVDSKTMSYKLGFIACKCGQVLKNRPQVIAKTPSFC